MKRPISMMIMAAAAWVAPLQAQVPEQPKSTGKLLGGDAANEIHGMRMSLVAKAVFAAGEVLVFTLQLKNVSDHDLSFQVIDGFDGKTIGTMTWRIEEVKTGTIWKTVANPNPGPAPGMPVSMEIKTLKAGESLDVPVRVLHWGQLFGTATPPVRTAASLPAGTYVASVAVNVTPVSLDNKPQTNWQGNATLRSGKFDVAP